MMQLNLSTADVQLALDKAGISVARNGIVEKCEINWANINTLYK